MDFDQTLYLASQSPRRRELIGQHFQNVRLLSLAAFDEPRWRSKQLWQEYLDECVGAKWQAALLELEKAAPSREPHALLVADTIVVLGKEVLGKPQGKVQAAQMLGQLSGKKHRVYTGFRLGLRGQARWQMHDEVVTSEVTFHPLSRGEISAYVKTGQPLDKAGSYGFQDRALRFVRSLEGSYANVMGLPVQAVAAAAQKLGMR